MGAFNLTFLSGTMHDRWRPDLTVRAVRRIWRGFERQFPSQHSPVARAVEKRAFQGLPTEFVRGRLHPILRAGAKRRRQVGMRLDQRSYSIACLTQPGTEQPISVMANGFSNKNIDVQNLSCALESKKEGCLEQMACSEESFAMQSTEIDPAFSWFVVLLT